MEEKDETKRCIQETVNGYVLMYGVSFELLRPIKPAT